jgi:hypothetical protein
MSDQHFVIDTDSLWESLLAKAFYQAIKGPG